ncbi:hypothetical protein GCM10009738_32170 [Kitasatospora viridis]
MLNGGAARDGTLRCAAQSVGGPLSLDPLPDRPPSAATFGTANEHTPSRLGGGGTRPDCAGRVPAAEPPDQVPAPGPDLAPGQSVTVARKTVPVPVSRVSPPVAGR